MNDSAWWVTGEDQVLAGPFSSKADADLAGPPPGETWEDVEDLSVVYGTRLANGTIEQRPSPADISWYSHLAAQLDRVSDGHDLPLSDRSRHAELARQVATRLVEVGFNLHDCAGRTADKALGGVCVTPTADGVLVSWTQHDRAAVDHVHGSKAQQHVQQVLNAALYEVLCQIGFEVQPFGQHDIALVVAKREL